MISKQAGLFISGLFGCGSLSFEGMGEKRQRELEIFEFMGNSDSLLAFKRGHFIL